MTHTTDQRTQDLEIIQAQVYGNMAFKAGIKSAAYLDKNLMEMLKGKKNGESLPLLKAWNTGWHQANLCAEVSHV